MLKYSRDNCLQLQVAHGRQGWILTAPGSQTDIALGDFSETLVKPTEAKARLSMRSKAKAGTSETVGSLRFTLVNSTTFFSN